MDISKSNCIKVSIFFDGLVDVDTVKVTHALNFRQNWKNDQRIQESEKEKQERRRLISDFVQMFLISSDVDMFNCLQWFWNNNVLQTTTTTTVL